MIRPSSSPASSGSRSRDGARQTPRSGFGSFATRAFVATATASATYAAYFLFGSVVAANGDAVVDETVPFAEEAKREGRYGIEYVGFDSYPGVERDDGTGVATREFKAASADVVSRALDAAGLDGAGMLKGAATGADEDITMHPKHAHRLGIGTCPSYGCPFLPLDVHYEEDARAQLESMRKEPSSGGDEGRGGAGGDGDGKEYLLKSSGSERAATLTLIGYKGGRLENQINQDRALALSPYLYWNINSPSGKADSGAGSRPVARLIGAFDGHARFGEKVSEYVAKTLPALLGSKLAEYDSKSSDNAASGTDKDRRDHDIGAMLRDTFLELDATSPADPSGGCTASVVLQIGTRVYVANAGDSRSFVVAHAVPPSGGRGGGGGGGGAGAKATTSVVYGTREDKPHISSERVRVEHMGGTVYLPNGFLNTGKGTTRVLYQDPTTGSTSGLAMSRSIGDWDAGEVGVIPDPLIDILDIKEIKKRVLETLNRACNDDAGEVEIDPASGESSSTKSCIEYTEQDIKIFAVSATDGLLDYLPEEAIANHVAKGLYGALGPNDGEGDDDDQKSSHPLLVCEDLIYAAAQGWQEDKGGKYRDDIAIAVADLELE